MPGLVFAALCLVVLLALAMAYDRRQRHRRPTSDVDERRARAARARNGGNTGGRYLPGDSGPFIDGG